MLRLLNLRLLKFTTFKLLKLHLLNFGLTRFRVRAVIVLQCLLMAACTQPESSIETTPSGDTRMNLLPPRAVLSSRAIDDAALNLEVRINGEPIVVQRQDNEWVATTRVAEGSTAELELFWRHGSITLASYSRSLGVVVDHSNWAVADSDYNMDEHDFDRDEINNIAELSCDTNVTDRNHPGSGDLYQSVHACLSAIDTSIPLPPNDQGGTTGTTSGGTGGDGGGTTTSGGGEGNRPPVYQSGLADAVLYVGEAIEPLSVIFTDADGDALGYAAIGLPDGLSIDSGTGVVSGIATEAARFNGVRVLASDGNGGAGESPPITLVVEHRAAAPVCTVNGPLQQTVALREPMLAVELNCTDVNGGPLTFALTAERPAGLTLTSDGTSATLAGAPTTARNYEDVRIRATDPGGLYHEEVVRVLVNDGVPADERCASGGAYVFCVTEDKQLVATELGNPVWELSLRPSDTFRAIAANTERVYLTVERGTSEQLFTAVFNHRGESLRDLSGSIEDNRPVCAASWAGNPNQSVLQGSTMAPLSIECTDNNPASLLLVRIGGWPEGVTTVMENDLLQVRGAPADDGVFSNLFVRVTDQDRLGATTPIFNLRVETNVDLDDDGIDNAVDNCPALANAAQLDNDQDNIGDACDTDDQVQQSVESFALSAAPTRMLIYEWEARGPLQNPEVQRLNGVEIVGSTSYPDVAAAEVPASLSYSDVVSVPLVAGSTLRLRACGTVTCYNSPVLPVDGVLDNAIAYLKSPTAVVDDYAAASVGVSSDGTFIVTGGGVGEGAALLNAGLSTAAVQAAATDSAIDIFQLEAGELSHFATIGALADEPIGHGSQLALSADASLIATATQNEGFGRIHSYTRIDDSWVALPPVTHSDADTQPDSIFRDDLFGAGFDVSADGMTLVVGAPGEDSAAMINDGDEADNTMPDAGAVYVYRRSGNDWIRQAYLKAANAAIGARFGTAVAVSADGNTLVVGAPRVTDAAQPDLLGAIYIFGFSGGSWAAQAYLPASAYGAADAFGSVVAINDDGTAVAAAAREDGNGLADGSGYVEVFNLEQRSWFFTQRLLGRDIDGDLFGSSLSLSAAGETLLIGAPGDSSNAVGVASNQQNQSLANAGSGYLFSVIAGVWVETAYLKATVPGAGDRFGVASALSGDGEVIVLGAPGEDGTGPLLDGLPSDNSTSNSGAAYIY